MIWTLEPGSEPASVSTTLKRHHWDQRCYQWRAWHNAQRKKTVLADHIDYLWSFVLSLQVIVLFHCIHQSCALPCRHNLHWKNQIFWLQMWTKFSGSAPIYFRTKCSEQFKSWCTNQKSIHSLLVEKGSDWKVMSSNTILSPHCWLPRCISISCPDTLISMGTTNSYTLLWLMLQKI